MIDFALGQAVEYDEVIDSLTAFFLGLCPDDIVSDARHDGFEPLNYGGLFPAAACFEQDYEDEPKTQEASMQPGIITIGFRIYEPSVGAGLEQHARARASKETRRLEARWREAIYADPTTGNFNMQGLVTKIQLIRGESGDHDRLGFALAYDEDTESYLWVRHTDIRVTL